tara:strand:+ start:108 stop:413 length:306 start_codon:yes stop_codon:yes gene_type:complete
MTTIIDKVNNALQKYKSLGEGKDSLAQRDALVTQMRIDITSFQNLPPSATLDKRECILAREVYEQAIFISVEKEDVAAFERNFSIIRTYYDELDPIIGIES